MISRRVACCHRSGSALQAEAEAHSGWHLWVTHPVLRKVSLHGFSPPSSSEQTRRRIDTCWFSECGLVKRARGERKPIDACQIGVTSRDDNLIRVATNDQVGVEGGVQHLSRHSQAAQTGKDACHD
jgi:hypothetical protein